MTGAEQVRAQAQEVAAGWSPPDAPGSWQLTASLFGVIAGHEELIAELASLPPDRLPALLASAAVSFLVRRDAPEPLAGYFPEPGGPQPPFDAGFRAAANAFISARLRDILELCRERRYQMNEVARCTQIALGMAATVSPAAGPAALIDLGTGAGLGLHLDRYRYQVGEHAFGPERSGLTLSCEPRGPVRPPLTALPPIAERTGIDADPIDLADGTSRAWLEACAPPEASALTRLAAAIGIARQHPARVVAGDVLDVLPGILACLPPRCPAIVADAYLAVFLPPERLLVLTEILADAARARPVSWLSLDPLVRDYQQQGVFAVLGTRSFGGGSQPGNGGPGGGRLLARAHPSGQWVQWLA